jgi:DNA repair protein RecO (recombination protein O)
VAGRPPEVGENGQVAIYRDDGIVLRTHKLGEADRIVTVLARKSGRIRAVAKGVRRTKSRFGARLEPFTHVDLLLYTGRSLDVITQVHHGNGHAGDRGEAHSGREGAGHAPVPAARRRPAGAR